MITKICVYRINHPNTTVYNVDVNQALKHAIASFQGKHPKPLFTSEGIEVPLMPKPGEVDFIYGGKFFVTFNR